MIEDWCHTAELKILIICQVVPKQELQASKINLDLYPLKKSNWMFGVGFLF
jgi:hypothetical protein